MNYENILSQVMERPLRVSKGTVGEYLREVFEYHSKFTPHWRDVRNTLNPDVDKVFHGSPARIMENLLNGGFAVEEDYLRVNWLQFLPEGYTGRVRFYQSSGTTRERAIGHWDAQYLKALNAYLYAALDEIYGLSEVYGEGHRMRAIAHGPYGWYQDEVSELVWRYGGTLYFIGMETDGLKRVLREQGLEATLRLLDPLVKYTERVMKTDTSVNTVRTAPPFMPLFKPYAEGMETAMISGVGIDKSFVGYFEENFSRTTFIPFYGYYLFGDLVGVQKRGHFTYYPNYPFTLVFPVKREEDRWRVVDYGERGRSAFVIARPEVFVVKVENETSIRAKPREPFEWDGFSDPNREV